MTTEQVILVDKNDQPRGSMEKMKAHQKGEMHRAFSLFIFNSKEELLLQKRSLNKYHSAGLWSNTCCSHPNPEEDMLTSAHRKLKEEMGFDCGLHYAFQFIYREEFENGLIEHELDHVFIGFHDGEVKMNTNEASEWRFLKIEDLNAEMKHQPEQFTSWLKLIIPEKYLQLQGKDEVLYI